jgi:transposase
MRASAAWEAAPTLERLAAFVPTCRSRAGLRALDLIGACPNPRESCQPRSHAITKGGQMITIGIDAPKQVHVAVALNESGQQIGQWRGNNSRGGWGELHHWAMEQGNARRWGSEGAGNYGRGLAQHLVMAGEQVYDVNPRWTAQSRRRARTLAKNDRLDAQAVAMLVWREGEALPAVAAEDTTALLDLLVTQRDDVLAEATRLRNQIHQLLLQLDPEYRLHLPKLQSRAGMKAIADYVALEDTPLQHARAAAVRRLAARLQLALQQAEELAEQIERIAAARSMPLTQLCGINLLTAGMLAGVLGPGQRFATDAQLAADAGVAPLEASSAAHLRHRLNRGGNRRLNAILDRIAVTQRRYSDEAKAYVAKRRKDGKTGREAMRSLKRYIARAIWRLWKECASRTVEIGKTVSRQAA